MPRAQPPRPLTPEQRSLAEINTPLIGAAVDTYPGLWPRGDREEALGIATDAFMRAVAAFGPGRGQLSTLVYACTRRALFDARRIARRRAEHRRVYVRELARRQAHATAPRIAEPLDTRWLELLDERTRRVVELRAAGLTYRQVGEEVGLTRERVRQLITQKARPIARAWLEAGGELERS